MITEMTYDLAGNQLSLTDPSTGTTIYEYDLLGQLTKQTYENGEVFDLTYDTIGRLATMSNTSEGTTTYTYVSSGNGLGLVQSVSNSTSNISKTYTYDEYARVTTETETIEAVQYSYDYTYDVLGRVSEMEYPGDVFSIAYKYDNYGRMVGVNDVSDNNIWELKAMNELGGIEEIEYGNGLTTTYSYDSYNYLDEIITENTSAVKRQHLQFAFNDSTGNLNYRNDLLANSGTGITETFHYDDLDRLTQYKVGSNPAFTMNYNTDGTGRFDSKSDLGSYSYGENSAPEYAMTSITGSDGTVINNVQQDITWTSFNKIEEIIEGTMSQNFTYGPGRQRKITELYDGGTTPSMKKIFVGGLYEIEEDDNGNERHLYYVPGMSGEAAIYVIENSDPGELYYLHKDHLGSYQTITDENGAIVDTLSFDPWGRRRNANDWTYSNVPDTFLFDRGFTGHEHLDVFQLVNMNGRLYDAQTATFLSPDNFVQVAGITYSVDRINLNQDYFFFGFENTRWPTPLLEYEQLIKNFYPNKSDYSNYFSNTTIHSDSVLQHFITQNFNRYIYGLNNPTKYTDPTGENFIETLLDAGFETFQGIIALGIVAGTIWAGFLLGDAVAIACPALAPYVIVAGVALGAVTGVYVASLWLEWSNSWF
ncbi:MAG: hypothetical protein JW801_09345 [Bacteroidales bacterium]|nr:hypothetical protein [Bacteroidales bacterium]